MNEREKQKWYDLEKSKVEAIIEMMEILRAISQLLHEK